MNKKDKLEQETINKLLQEQLLLEFANISKNDYKTPVGLWVDEAGNKRQNEHGGSPRIKIVNNYDEDFNNLIDVTISDNPEPKPKNKLKISNSDFNKMRQFIIKNKDILLKRYNNEITTAEMFRLLDKNNK